MGQDKVLKRHVTPDIQASRNRDIESVLDDYRENLRDHGVVDEDAIEDFVSSERDKMRLEYDSLDKGECSSNIYHMPTDWEAIAGEMKEHEEEMAM